MTFLRKKKKPVSSPIKTKTDEPLRSPPLGFAASVATYAGTVSGYIGGPSFERQYVGRFGSLRPSIPTLPGITTEVDYYSNDAIFTDEKSGDVLLTINVARFNKDPQKYCYRALETLLKRTSSPSVVDRDELVPVVRDRDIQF